MIRLPLMSRRKADAIANGIFLILLGLIFLTDAWWPGLLIAIVINLAVRQYLTGRKKDLFITLMVLGSIMLIALISVSLSILLPVLFIIGGGYLIAREYFPRDRLYINDRYNSNFKG